MHIILHIQFFYVSFHHIILLLYVEDSRPTVESSYFFQIILPENAFIYNFIMNPGNGSSIFFNKKVVNFYLQITKRFYFIIILSTATDGLVMWGSCSNQELFIQ